VPLIVGVQVEVWLVKMDAGEQTTETAVIVLGTATVTVVEPDLVESLVDVAVMVAVPAVAGVKTPVLVTAPMLPGVTVHATAEL